MHRPSLAAGLPAVALLSALLAAAPAQDDSELPHGMDVGGAVRAVDRWIGPGKPPVDKPWANDLADLTDPEPARYEPAIARLVGHGRHSPGVVTDLAQIAGDRDPRIRSRATLVLTGIGGSACAPLLLQLTSDRDRQVRVQAVVGLSRCPGDEVVDRLVALLSSDETALRESAARSIGELRSLRAFPGLVRQVEDEDDLVRREKRTALRLVANQPEAVPLLAEALGLRDGDIRDALIEAAGQVRDRRLVPALLVIAGDPSAKGRRASSAWTQLLALRALASGGDRRALEVVCRLADAPGSEEIRLAAAEAGKALTGYGAGPGRAWAIWWQDHQTQASRWGEIDAFLAEIHDPATTPTREQLAAFTPVELDALLDGVLETDAERTAAWWPGQALRAIRADDPARWAPAIADRCLATPSALAQDRLGLIMLLDTLDGPAVGEALSRIATDLVERSERERRDQADRQVTAPDHRLEQTALAPALTRRQLPVPF